MQYLPWRFRRVRVVNDNGELTEAGAEWGQAQDRKLQIMTVGVLMVIGAFFVVDNPLVFTALLVGGLFVAAVLPFLFRTTQTVVFSTEGKVLAPHGLPRGMGGMETVRFAHSRINSIQPVALEERHGVTKVTEDDQRHGVALHTFDGDTVFVARLLSPEQARKVAVQLTSALAEIREAIAAREHPTAAMSASDSDLIN